MLGCFGNPTRLCRRVLRVFRSWGAVGADAHTGPRIGCCSGGPAALWPIQPLVVCTATLGQPHVGYRAQGATALDGGALTFPCGAGEARLVSSVLVTCPRRGRSESGRTPEPGEGGSLPAGQVLGGVGHRRAAGPVWVWEGARTAWLILFAERLPGADPHADAHGNRPLAAIQINALRIRRCRPGRPTALPDLSVPPT